MAGVTIERSGGFSKEEHAINKLTRVAQWRSRCGTYVYLRQMPWHSPNTVSPSAKVPPCLPHEHHRQQGRPTARRSSNNLTASTSSSRHAASYHPFQVGLAVRQWCPRAAPARAAAGSMPLRRRGSGVCSACAPRGAKRPRARRYRMSKPRQRGGTNFAQELLLREEMDRVGLSLARPLSKERRPGEVPRLALKGQCRAVGLW